VDFRTAQAPIPNERRRCLRLHIRFVIMTCHTGANPVLTALSSAYEMTIYSAENPIFSRTAARPSNIVPYTSSKNLSLYIQYQQAILHIYRILNPNNIYVTNIRILLPQPSAPKSRMVAANKHQTFTCVDALRRPTATLMPINVFFDAYTTLHCNGV